MKSKLSFEWFFMRLCGTFFIVVVRKNFKVAVFLVLIKEGKILLQRRFNTGWEDGNYSFISGHVEENEHVLNAVRREAYEEAGIEIHYEDMEVVHVMQNKTDYDYINIFVRIHKWNGQPVIKEEDKCDDLSWFETNDLPENLLHFLKEFLKKEKGRGIFSAFGYELLNSDKVDAGKK